MNLTMHVRVVGMLLLALAALNLFLPKRFHWQSELEKVSLLTRQVFQVHYLFIVLSLVLMGVLSLVFTEALLEPGQLARVVLAGLTLFWVTRFLVQWIVYDRALWWGRRFETLMHVVFTCLWCYFSLIYGIAWWSAS